MGVGNTRESGGGRQRLDEFWGSRKGDWDRPVRETGSQWQGSGETELGQGARVQDVAIRWISADLQGSRYKIWICIHLRFAGLYLCSLVPLLIQCSLSI